MQSTLPQAENLALAPTPGSLFEGTASNWDYAVKMAEGKLGKITGHGSNNTVHYSKAGWCKLEWLSSYQEIRATDLPTIALPSRFQIVKANAEVSHGGTPLAPLTGSHSESNDPRTK